MPNICWNTIQMSGNKEDFKTLYHETKTEGHEGRFREDDKTTIVMDIRKAKMPPEEFELIVTGGNTINGKHVNKWWNRNTETNKIERRNIFDEDYDNSKWIDEEIPQEHLDDLIDKYGSDNFFDWVSVHWGTKWVTSVSSKTLMENLEVYEDDDFFVEFEVESAWGPPGYLLEYISQRYNLTISCDWHEESGEEGYFEIEPFVKNVKTKEE